MKKEFITNDSYLPMAKKIWGFISSHFEQEPSVNELASIIGSLEAVKFGINKTLKEMGHEIIILPNENEQKQ